MKRKHDTVVDGRRAAKTADAHRLPTNEQSPQNLQQQDLATERRYMGPKGWCLLAKQQARARSLVMEYIGEVITKAEAQQRTKVYDDEEIQALHLLHLSPSTVIDATRTGNDARYMAHSQDPNCQCQKWVVDNQPRAFMVALRDIAPGEELTYNYYRQCSLGEQVRCLCGAARCHSNQGTPVLQSQSETERMADAVLKCIQETTFGSVQDLQANDQTAPPARSQVSTPPYAKQLPLCTVSPSAFCSPPPATREDINALGQQQSGEAPAVPPVDAVLGTLPPPNTPEGLQSCQAGVNSTLKTLGLSQDQIHQILRNAEALTTDFGLKVPVL
ncbi:hypothetical protein WJX82_008127 [Trebouxia sp. C0006]